MAVSVAVITLAILLSEQADGRRKFRDNPVIPSARPSLVTSEEVTQFCSLMPWMKPHQKQKCLLEPLVMPSVQRGVGMALEECPSHYSDHKWNCSGVNTAQVFQERGILKTNTKESAFVFALTSAGVSFQITKGCSLGNWEQCGCDTQVRGRVQTKDEASWEWGGCSENVGHGDDFSRKFMDPEPPRKELEYLLVKHNNEAGRKALKDNMGKTCKCHGVSGSCTVKICWRTMPNFSVVPQLLRKKFDQATKVKANDKKTKLQRITRGKRGKKKRQKGRRPSAGDLVFAEKSPKFCIPNPELGILGTRGRVCDANAKDNRGCKKMCCNRGYDTFKLSNQVKCNCEFIWCCKVQCDMCKKDWTEYRCR
uniref:Protein Wnt n=1 Tax=Nematostella vectensis TaxID=45351 RepID=Q5J1S6_NEMVE|nr:secreted signalling factor wnt-A [Nematostella vectensis]